MSVHPASVLFVTLDSCRYDVFQAAHTPNLDGVGPAHRAVAPGSFTYASHAAMFVGFTPAVPGARESFLNPKAGKIFKMVGTSVPPTGREHLTLEGRNVIDGLKRAGHATFGTGSVGWFDPAMPTGLHLSQDFDEFFFSGDTFSLDRQLDFARAAVRAADGEPLLLFMNVGETHVPYWYEGAPWSPDMNPCVPFATAENDAVECRRRQTACLEHVDQRLGWLLGEFRDATTVVCADHGDAWGELGEWEHGIPHPKVLEVPLVFRLGPPR